MEAIKKSLIRSKKNTVEVNAVVCQHADDMPVSTHPAERY